MDKNSTIQKLKREIEEVCSKHNLALVSCEGGEVIAIVDKDTRIVAATITQDL